MSRAGGGRGGRGGRKADGELASSRHASLCGGSLFLRLREARALVCWRMRSDGDRLIERNNALSVNPNPFFAISFCLKLYS